MKLAAWVCPVFWTLCLALWAGPLPAADDDAEADTAPGVIARFQSAALSGAQPVVVERIEAVPRLFASSAGPGLKESAAHELPPGETRVQWSGMLTIPYRGQYVFTARRSTLDELKITIAGHDVALGQPIELAPGASDLMIAGLERSGSPAFELWWRSPHFADEPIDARHFRHDPAAAVKTTAPRRALADRGAVLADTLSCFRCHAGPEALGAASSAGLPPGTLLPGPRLDKLADRVHAPWVVDWLLNPHAIEPSRACPGCWPTRRLTG